MCLGAGACLWKATQHVDAVTSLCAAALPPSEQAIIEALALEETVMTRTTVLRLG